MNNVNQDQDAFELLRQWQHAIRICHKSHTRTAGFMATRNRALGIPVVILSAIAGTTVFATIEASPVLWVKISVGLLSVTAAVLASLQTFLGYSELSEKHKMAAQKYGAMRREIEEKLATQKIDSVLPADFITTMRTRWDAIDGESPSLSQALYDEIAVSLRK